MKVLRKLGVLVSLAGLVMTVIGVIGLVSHWGSSSAANRVATASSVAASAPGASAAGAAKSSSPAASAAAEDPQTFFAEFSAAIRGGNTTFLVNRMAPAVIARYGAKQCEQEAANLVDPTQQLRLVSVNGPEQYVYLSDGRSAVVANTYVFHVDGTAAGRSGPRDYHFALVDGQFRLFADCGTPVPSK